CCEQVCELGRELYQLGWLPGRSGSFSIRSGDRIYVPPSGVDKGRLTPEQIFITDLSGRVLDDMRSYVRLADSPKMSANASLFREIYRLRDAGAVLHTHSQNACLASLVFGSCFRVGGLEMLKCIAGATAGEALEVPIIENASYEPDLLV